MQIGAKRFTLQRVSLVIITGATVDFLLHMYIAPGYGFFFDELYTNALSRHLAIGYVDLPPLIPALVVLSRLLFGGSLFASHILPALAGSFTLVFACMIAREFGGKTFAVALRLLCLSSSRAGLWQIPFFVTTVSTNCVLRLSCTTWSCSSVRDFWSHFLRRNIGRIWSHLGPGWR